MSQCLTLNSEQENAICSLREFLKSKTHKIIVLEGYAGTGKSTIISHLFKDPDYSKMNVCMSATTNKAVSVLKEMGKIENKKIDYLTIHKLMRIKRTIDSDGKQQFITSFNETTDSRNKKCKSIFSYNVIVIDEASMINKTLFHDLEVISKRIVGKIIFVGDRNQLPPVNQTLSDVFIDDKYKIISLTKVMRSTGDNNIVNISNYVRTSITDKNKLKLKQFRDDNVAIFRKQDSWLDSYIQHLKNTGKKSIILAYTNFRCQEINNLVRKVLFSKEQTSKKFLPGEHIVFNNYYQNATNKYYTSQSSIIKDVSPSKLNIKKLNLFSLINLKDKLDPFNNNDSIDLSKIDNPCPICKTEEIDLDVVTVCEHKLCLECAKGWLNKHKCCPLCLIELKGEDDFIIKDNPRLTGLLNKFAEYIETIEFDAYKVKLVNNDVIYTLTEKSKEKYDATEIKIKDMMSNIKLEVLRSKRIINFGLVILSRLWLYIFNNVIDLFADISYGYCITSHKSQGSTYNNVYVDIANILKYNRDDIDGLKCLYTAITRTADNLNLFY
jgi:hypothetical protein